MLRLIDNDFYKIYQEILSDEKDLISLEFFSIRGRYIYERFFELQFIFLSDIYILF